MKAKSFLNFFRKKSKLNRDEAETFFYGEDEKNSKSISGNLENNLDCILKDFGNSDDVKIRRFSIESNQDDNVAIIFIEGLADNLVIQNFILESLMNDFPKTNYHNHDDLFHAIKKTMLPVGEIRAECKWSNIYSSLLDGNTVIMLEGCKDVLIGTTAGGEKRGVEEPSSETVVRGPKEGFSESIRINTSLIRRKIKDKALWIESRTVGKRTKTSVAIVYMKGLAKDKLVNEVRSRLNKIDIDAILESSYIEEFIQDKTYTPFPTIFNTERPDVVAAGLLEGRIAILVDGTPYALLAPAIFIEFFHASEDYYQRFDISSFIRILRFFSFFLALLVPSVYIAITTFHQEMIPTALLISLAAQREGVPFPALIEALLMEITFEILREAGIRMPRAVGSAISIVGALVLGQAAVEAGLVSSTMVIVVSITAISSFVMPAFNMAISVRLLRFGFMALASIIGLYGIIIGILCLVLHLCSLRSFGVPYLSAMGPYINEDQKDMILRYPHWALKSRPRLIPQKDKYER